MTETDFSSVDKYSDDDACFRLIRDMQNVEVIARFAVEGEPVSKARARFTGVGSKTRTYTPEKTKQAESVVGWKFRQAAPTHRVDAEWTYGVGAVFFAGTQQRRDVDNMLKLILDALTGLAWVDDSQVSEVTGRRGSDLPENARTEILIYRISTVGKPKGKCVYCGSEYDTYPSWEGRRKYCSDVCRVSARAKARLRDCAQCGRQFSGTNLQTPPKFCSRECHALSGRVEIACKNCGVTFTKQRCHVRTSDICSVECRDAYLRTRRRGLRKGDCISCGGPVSRREYQRCRPCHLEFIGAGVTGKPGVAP